MSRASYWLSASVLTITSAPSLSDASSPAWNAARQPLVVGQPHDVVDAVLARDLDRAVGRAVVDHEPLDLVEPLDAPWQVAQGDGEGVLLVEAGDLDDQLHLSAGGPGARQGSESYSSVRNDCVNWAPIIARGLRVPVTVPPASLPRHFDGERNRQRGVPGSLGAVSAFARCRPTGWRCSAFAGSRSCSRSSASSCGRPTRTTTATTRCCGDARCSISSSRASRPTARRPSIRWRSSSAPCCRCSATAPTGCSCSLTLLSLVDARRRHLQARARLLHAVRRRDRRRPGADAVRLPVARGARLHRHPLHGDGRVGGRARGGAAAPRGCRSSCCSRRPACCVRRRWLLAGLYFLWMSWGATLGRALPLRGADRDRPRAVGGDRLRRHGRSALLAQLDAGPRGRAAPPEVRLGRARGAAASSCAGRSRRRSTSPVSPDSRSRSGSSRSVFVIPFVLFLTGVFAFVATGMAGLSVIVRYLMVPSVMMCLFAGVALGGFTMLPRGSRLRRAWAVAAAAATVIGIAYTTINPPSLKRFDCELTFRGDVSRSLRSILRKPAVEHGLRCGAVSVPTHKLIPDVRWILDLGESRVVARSDPSAAAKRKARYRSGAVPGRAQERAAHRIRGQHRDAHPGARAGVQAHRHRPLLLRLPALPARTRITARGSRRLRAPSRLDARRRWAARARVSGCGCGESSTGCRTSTTSTRTRTSCRRPSASSRATTTRTTSSTRRRSRTCCTGCSRSGSAAAGRSARATPCTTPTRSTRPRYSSSRA